MELLAFLWFAKAIGVFFGLCGFALAIAAAQDLGYLPRFVK